MELVLEHDEIEELLKEALQSRGITLSPELRMIIRRNNKKGTIRAVYKPLKRRGRRTGPRSGTEPDSPKDQGQD